MTWANRTLPATAHCQGARRLISGAPDDMVSGPGLGSDDLVSVSARVLLWLPPREPRGEEGDSGVDLMSRPVSWGIPPPDPQLSQQTRQAGARSGASKVPWTENYTLLVGVWWAGHRMWRSTNICCIPASPSRPCRSGPPSLPAACEVGRLSRSAGLVPAPRSSWPFRWPGRLVLTELKPELLKRELDGPNRGGEGISIADAGCFRRTNDWRR
jgi:hypothetical protein